jgi:hypothetical protein
VRDFAIRAKYLFPQSGQPNLIISNRTGDFAKPKASWPPLRNGGREQLKRNEFEQPTWLSNNRMMQ